MITKSARIFVHRLFFVFCSRSIGLFSRNPLYFAMLHSEKSTRWRRIFESVPVTELASLSKRLFTCYKHEIRYLKIATLGVTGAGEMEGINFLLSINSNFFLRKNADNLWQFTSIHSPNISHSFLKYFPKFPLKDFRKIHLYKMFLKCYWLFIWLST